MLDLLRRDPILEVLPRWILFAALNASVVEGLRTFSLLAMHAGLRGVGPDVHLGMTVFILWLTLVPFLLSGNSGRRCRTFDLGLPLSARRLWLTHWTAVLLGGLILLSTSSAVIGLHRWLIGGGSEFLQGINGLMRCFLSVLAMAILVITVLQSWQSSQHRIRFSWMGWCMSLLLFIVAGEVSIAFLYLHPAIISAPLGLALLIGLSCYRSLPQGLDLLPKEGKPAKYPLPTTPLEPQRSVSCRDEPARTTADQTGGGWVFRWFLVRTILRTLAKNPAAFFTPYIFLIFFGIWISGFLTAFGGHGHDDYEYVFLPLVVYMLFSFLLVPLSSLYYLDPLPISRRFLCGLILLPGLGTYFISYGIGKVGLACFDEPGHLVLYQQEDAGLHIPPYLMKNPILRIPAEYGRIAWDGQVPDIRTPWGETHSPWQAPLFRGSRITIYSPFSTDKQRSTRFVAWQLSRAVRTIYGMEIPPDRIQECCLADSNTGPVLSGKDLSLSKAFPELPQKKQTTVFVVFPLLLIGSFLLMVAFFLQAFRAGVSETKRKRLFYGMLALCMLAVMGQIAMIISGLARPVAASGFLKILCRQLIEIMPGGETVVWGVALLFCGGLYWWVQGRFERVEVPVPKSKVGA